MMLRSRVRVTLDEKGAERRGRELPFSLGVLGDFVADGAAKPFSERRFIKVDRESLNEVMRRLRPRLVFRVSDGRGTPSATAWPLDLEFRSLADFEPAAILRQVGELRDRFAHRNEWQEAARQPVAVPCPGQDSGRLQQVPAETCSHTPSVNANPYREEIRVAQADRQLQWQLDAILHHPRFQRLEAVWRGLEYLLKVVAQAESQADAAGGEAPLAISILPVSKQELLQDFRSSLGFDESRLWQLVYEGEFGVAGGEPFGVLVADYEFRNHPDDLKILHGMAQIGAASLAPLIAGASPQLLGAARFENLHRELDLNAFDSPGFYGWRKLREMSDTRFLGLCLPRILLRIPYDSGGESDLSFPYREDVTGRNGAKLLWGNAAFALAAVLIQAFAQTGWFADIIGFGSGYQAARLQPNTGLVPGLPLPDFSTDSPGVAPKMSVDVMIDDDLQAVLETIGLIPLCVAPGRSWCVFHGSASLYRPQTYRDPQRTASEKLGASLQQVLCISRFGHYLKVLAQRSLGDVASPRDMEARLREWVSGYVNENAGASPKDKIRYPLRKAVIRVHESLEQPGVYQLDFRLTPHLRLAEWHTEVQMTTQLLAPQLM